MKRHGVDTPPAVCLLDGNVLVALADAAHVHHDAVVRWFVTFKSPFATCPLTQGTLLRMLLQFKAVDDISVAAEFLKEFSSHELHRFWPDGISYASVSWKGVMGPRQVTDCYLAALARQQAGKLITLDKALAALHADVAYLIET